MSSHILLCLGILSKYNSFYFYPLGDTILHVSAKSGHTATTTWILDTYPKLMKVNNNHNESPVKLAAASGHVATTKILIQYGLKPYNDENQGKVLKDTVSY